jgi:hypothetical protein
MSIWDDVGFQSAPCTRCLECTGTRFTIETKRPFWDNANASEIDRHTEYDFWWCEKCGDYVPIGLGSENEVIGEIDWLEDYPNAYTGTQDISRVEPQPPRYEIRRVGLQIVVEELDDSLPTIEESLREHNDPPVQVQLETSALAIAWLALSELHGDKEPDKTIDFAGEVLTGDEILERIQRIANEKMGRNL